MIFHKTKPHPPKTALSLASLVKGEVLSPPKNSVDYWRDCSPSPPSMRFSALSLSLFVGEELAPPVAPNLSIPTTFSKAHQPLRPALNLPPLSKGGGLTARHKLLLHCVCLQYICLFYSPNFSAVKTEGLLHRYPFAPHQPLPKPHYPLLRTTFLAYERSVGFASLRSLWAFNFGHPCPSLAKGSWIATRLLLIINCLAQRFKYI